MAVAKSILEIEVELAEAKGAYHKGIVEERQAYYERLAFQTLCGSSDSGHVWGPILNGPFCDPALHRKCYSCGLKQVKRLKLKCGEKVEHVWV